MKKLYLILSLMFVLLLFTMAVGASDVSVEAEDSRVFEVENGAFNLPSYVSPSNVKFTFEDGLNVKYVDENGGQVSITSGTVIDLTPFKQTVPTGQEYYIVKFYVNSNSRSYVFNFGSLPSVHVETSIGKDTLVSTNGKDVETKATVINTDGTYEYVDSANTFSELKVRGNTTPDYAKKPFQLKFSAKADLFGMGSSKTWILLANYLDQSQIRNSVMYEIGKILGMHTSEFQLVDLYLDGEYYGIYLLCEKVQISSARLDIVELEKLNDKLNSTYSDTPVKVTTGIENTIITEYSYIPGIKNPTDITGGYLIELDNNYWKDELCYFVTENGSHYVIKSPEYASKEQVEYIATLFGEMEEALMSSTGCNRLGRHYSEYMDVDSFVAAYIVAEFSRNYDAGSSSMYFYKDADVNGEVSKIVKGPLWDCDNTLGNIHKNGASDTEGYWAKGRSIWAGLTQQADFNQKVTEKFASVYDQIFDMIDVGGYIYGLVDEIGNSIYMERARWHSDDYSKWPTYYDGTHYDRWQSSPVFNFVDGYYTYDLDKDNTTVIGYLCEHIEERLNWVATAWDCDVEIRERSFVEKEPDPTPTPNPDENPDSSTQDSSTVDSSTIDSGTVDSSTNHTGTTDSTAPTSDNQGNEDGNGEENTVLVVIIAVLGVLALGGMTTAVVLGIKLKK